MPKKSPKKQPAKPRLSAKSQNEPSVALSPATPLRVNSVEGAKEGKSTSKAEPLIPRPPIVCFLGHVDHGKTSLLDYIRQTHVQEGEAGGITQSIGAYHTEGITFIDTPGHAAFTTMRARGGQTADIAVLVIAANDGVMPQTIEAINHIKAANVPMLVAINKMDLPSTSSEKVKQQLVEQGILLEGWGGDVVNVECSAITGEGIDNLLEMLRLMAEIEEFKSEPKSKVKGILLESSLDSRRGPVATVIVKQGTLRKGQLLVAENTYGRIKGLYDWQGKALDEVIPGFPAEVLGLKTVVRGGVKFAVVDTEKEAQELTRPFAVTKAATVREKVCKKEDEENEENEENKIKLIKLIIKADTNGSLVALRYSINHLENDIVQILFVHEGVGHITETDILLAQSSDAFVVGLKIKIDPVARQIIKQENIPVKTYDIIYQLLEDLKRIVKEKEKEGELIRMGLAKVLKVFILSNKSIVAGSKVEEGKLKLNQQVRIWRDKKQIGEGKIISLKILKKEVGKVPQGEECGVVVSPEFEFEKDDLIEGVEESRVDFSL